MRGDYIRAELMGQAFMCYEPYMKKITSAISSEIIRDTKDVKDAVNFTISGSVAVISIDGAMYKRHFETVSGSSIIDYDSIKAAIRRAEGVDSVKTIFFYVDTPGGSVAGLSELRSVIRECKKETVTLFTNLGASAGQYAFGGSDFVYATMGTELGSIGTVITIPKNRDEGDSMTLFSKNAENKGCNLDGKCLDKIQSKLDAHEKKFLEVMSENYNKTEEEIVSIFKNGDTIFEDEALANGVLDGIISFDKLMIQLESNNDLRRMI